MAGSWKRIDSGSNDDRPGGQRWNDGDYFGNL